jgi:hypothetical protein
MLHLERDFVAGDGREFIRSLPLTANGLSPTADGILARWRTKSKRYLAASESHWELDAYELDGHSDVFNVLTSVHSDTQGISCIGMARYFFYDRPHGDKRPGA